MVKCTVLTNESIKLNNERTNNNKKKKGKDRVHNKSNSNPFIHPMHTGI